MGQQQEREAKFDVPVGWKIPELTSLVPKGGTVEQRTVQLSSTYYDTTGHDLLAHRLTLRRRTGDTDQGWQLKVPSGKARTELRVDGEHEAVPEELLALLTGIRIRMELAPVAVVRNNRTVHRILDEHGALLAEVADDEVTTSVPGESTVSSRWHKVEVEPGRTSDKLLTNAGRLLAKSGATPSPSTSKLARALGESPVKTADPTTSLHALIDAYLHAQYDAITTGDVDLRRDLPVIHATRVGTRRFRSVLRVFGDRFERERAAHLDAELKWYAEILGGVRDRQVLRKHLDDALAGVADVDVLGPVRARIDETLVHEEREALTRLRETMNGARYLDLLRELRAWRGATSYVVGDRKPERVSRYVRAAHRTVRRRLAAGHDTAALHAARKAAKRARYAAELAEPVLGTVAASEVELGKELQDSLGEVQDSVVAAEFLRRLAGVAGTTGGENGFTFGILYQREQERAADYTARAHRLAQGLGR